MAPASAAVESCTSGQKSISSLRQLRKPVVEKQRRDRINSSIKQLRLLLEKEFQNDQLHSKLEKADILEMTVNYLKQRHLLVNRTSTPAKSPFKDYSQGYNRCLEETLQYLSYSEKMGHANQNVMQYFNRGHTASRKAPATSPPISEKSPKHVIWRPW
ncbi:transcription factor HES-5-like [Bufo gargarizans]|uniref:transcription factor HES-5-like n=1 Tax=Bufo gargarizans TaxID=30331 RepID=UPI001CF5802E|nr:transcription factor HES-5-like [Bufo gargarizans]